RRAARGHVEGEPLRGGRGGAVARAHARAPGPAGRRRRLTAAARRAPDGRPTTAPDGREEARYLRAFSLSADASEDSAAMKASCGTSTRPMVFMRFLPSFCFSSSLRLRVMSPP